RVDALQEPAHRLHLAHRHEFGAPLVHDHFELLAGADRQRFANAFRDHDLEFPGHGHGRHTPSLSIMKSYYIAPGRSTGRTRPHPLRPSRRPGPAAISAMAVAPSRSTTRAPPAARSTPR